MERDLEICGLTDDDPEASLRNTCLRGLTFPAAVRYCMRTAAAFYAVGDRPWMGPIPILGLYALSTDIRGGKPPSPIYLILAALSAAGFALVFVWLTTRLFSKEKIIFGR